LGLRNEIKLVLSCISLTVLLGFTQVPIQNAEAQVQTIVFLIDDGTGTFHEVPAIQFTAALPDACLNSIHFHAANGQFVIALDGTIIFDPQPTECGYGKEGELQTRTLTFFGSDATVADLTIKEDERVEISPGVTVTVTGDLTSVPGGDLDVFGTINANGKVDIQNAEIKSGGTFTYGEEGQSFSIGILLLIEEDGIVNINGNNAELVTEAEVVVRGTLNLNNNLKASENTIKVSGGKLNIRDGVLDMSGDPFLDDLFVNDNGEININNDGTLEVGNKLIVNIKPNSNINVNAGGTLRLEEGSNVTVDFNSGINVKAGGNVVNFSDDTVNNFGTYNNEGVTDNFGTFNNKESGTLNNLGVFNNHFGATFNNDGGTITGNPINNIPRSQAVGGEIIPIDSTALLLAGAQMNAAWMIPVIVSGIGFAIVIARKF